MHDTMLQIENLRVSMNGREILRGITLTIRTGQQWVIVGAAGSGKTVFGHTLAGYHAFQGRILFPGLPATVHQNRVTVIEQQHRFRNLQHQTSFYYQQRYNAVDAGATMTVRENLSAFTESLYESFSKAALLELFGLVPLLDEPLIQLSNGENKRLQMLKAVLGFQRFLILDEPFTGLDVEGRRTLDGILSALAASGRQLILLTSRDHVPACFTCYALLESGKLTVIKNREDIRMNQAAILPAGNTFPSTISFTYPAFRHAVRMKDVHVRYDGKAILSGINWAVESGACWALSGPNGAGKSTLLSLVTADNPQAYANEIYLFDRRRGSGESIWEIKQKIGFLSPELQLYFDPAATVFTALASGLFDTTGLFRRLSALQEQLVWEWLDFLGYMGFAHSLLSSLPGGMQRMTLLSRAMIKTPPLLVLDEPAQGLDAQQTAFTRQLIDRYCAHYGASLIYTSHTVEDFPSCIGHHLELKRGKIV